METQKAATALSALTLLDPSLAYHVGRKQPDSAMNSICNESYVWCDAEQHLKGNKERQNGVVQHALHMILKAVALKKSTAGTAGSWEYDSQTLQTTATATACMQHTTNAWLCM